MPVIGWVSGRVVWFVVADCCPPLLWLVISEGFVGWARWRCPGFTGRFIAHFSAVRVDAELELGDPRAFGVSVGLDTPTCVDEERQIVQVFWSSRYSLVDDEVI